MFSTILPRPSLKIRLYLNYSIRGLKGIQLASLPTFGIIIGCWYVLTNLNILKSVAGSYLDDSPINPDSTSDSTRVTKYLNGRLGTCISMTGIYILYISSNMLFPSIKVCENMKEIPNFNKEIRKLKGLFV